MSLFDVPSTLSLPSVGFNLNLQELNDILHRPTGFLPSRRDLRHLGKIARTMETPFAADILAWVGASLVGCESKLQSNSSCCEVIFPGASDDLP
jgi:hypothetical protein